MSESLKEMCERILKGGSRKELEEAAIKDYEQHLNDQLGNVAAYGIMSQINELVGPHNGGSPLVQRDNILKIIDVYIPMIGKEDFDASVKDTLTRYARILRAMTEEELMQKMKVFMEYLRKMNAKGKK